MILNQMSLAFINHASILIKGKNKSVLSDPWYKGEAFHSGWKLIVENNDEEILALIEQINYIWISHEHPDHFSIQFLKKFKQQLLENNVCFLFQETKDKRVIGWLIKEGFKVQELLDNTWFDIEENFKIKVVKDEFYDSALIAEVDGVRIFNLNDCPIHSNKRIQELHKNQGDCDILLTQFSYAAWKGGRENKSWRESSAQEKLQSVVDQANGLNAKIIVPFASFVRFSNQLNSYLNDSVNTPQKTVEFIRVKTKAKCVFMAPFDWISLDYKNVNESQVSTDFWEERFQSIANLPLDSYEKKIDPSELAILYKQYLDRIKKKNSWRLIKLIGMFRLFGAFQPIVIRLLDQDISVLVNTVEESLSISFEKPDVEMHSESLAFILKNPFGFDTLTVNGCFEEKRKGGFAKFTKVFALENLNVLGYSLSPYLIFNPSLIFIFLARIISVSKRLVKV